MTQIETGAMVRHCWSDTKLQYLTSFLDVFADGSFCSSTNSKFVSKLSLALLHAHTQYITTDYFSVARPSSKLSTR